MNTGLSSSLMPTAAGSGEKAAFREVSLALVEVVQFDCAPVAEVVQPEGNAGAVTASKFCSKGAASPSANENDTVPRLAAPSCNCSVAVSVAPQFPIAMKLNGSETVVLTL